MSATTTVGRFKYESGQISGPAEYMNGDGDAKLDSILGGNDIAYNTMIVAKPGIDPVTMILTALQTDYAGWRGQRELIASLKPKRPECDGCGTFIDEPGLCKECGQAQATTGQVHDSREGGGQWN